MLESLAFGFGQILNLNCMIALLSGAVIGYFVGAMPGLTPTIGIALLIPFTYSMDPVPSVVMLVALYMAAEYGGGITAILINTPGTPAAAATALDGYPLAQRGQAAKALGMSIIASGIGAFISTVLMILFAMPLADITITFNSPEYFCLAIMGLSVVAGLAGDAIVKGLSVVAFALLLTTIGIDPITGSFRYCFTYNFMSGIPLVPAMIGLFAISECFILMSKKGRTADSMSKIDGTLPTAAEIKRCFPTICRGSIIGFIVGMLPAAGANVACWVSYNFARNTSKNKDNFGKGELEGIASAESANNSAVCGALVPLLTMGIPGSSSTAVLIGALMIQGIATGPLLFTEHPEIPYSIFTSLILAVPLMLGMGLFGSRIFSLITLVPNYILSTVILGTATLGSYAINGNMYRVWIAYLFGIIAYFLRKSGFPLPPLVLALVLGSMCESNFRKSLLMGNGQLSIFVTKPYAVVIIIITVILFAGPFVKSWLQKRKTATQP